MRGVAILWVCLLLGSVLGLRGRVGGGLVGWGRGLADAGEGGVDFVLGEVLGAEKVEFLLVRGGGYGGVLQDWRQRVSGGQVRWVCLDVQVTAPWISSSRGAAMMGRLLPVAEI